MPNYGPSTKEDIKARIVELQTRLEAVEHRDQYLAELKTWMAKRKLSNVDLLWMYRQMAPKREQYAVRSKKPLHPEGAKARAVGFVRRGDPEFMRMIRAARRANEWSTLELAEKLGLSNATITNWECGRYIPMEERRQKIVALLKLPPDLGAETTAKMMASMGTPKRNSSAAHADD